MQPNPSDVFLQEAEDLLAEIESAALSMVEEGSKEDAVDQIFRAFHTIKGSGAMFGFENVAGFTHHVETLLDQVRDRKVPVTQELSNTILAATDHIRLLLQSAQGGPAVDAGSELELLARVGRLGAAVAPAASVQHAPQTEIVETTSSLQNWHIHFRPDPSILSRGGNPVLLFRDLRKLGECKIEAHLEDVPPLAEMQADVCYLWWTIELCTAADRADIQDVFLFVEDGSELRIEAVGLPVPQSAGPSSSAPAFVEAVGAAGATSQLTAAQPAAAEQEQRTSAPQAQSKEASVRVPATRLDRLVNLVGELVMNQSRLATAAQRFQSPELAAPVEEIERLVAELRDDVLQIRMMPIGTIFGRFRRLVHDLSLQLGKEIQLITDGEETELDKSILDQLGEPLVHLLRNSIDHGVESADDRQAAGKPRQGTIRLVATHRGSDVVVSIEDDGKGLNRDAIRAKAVAKQLIAPDANLSDKEIINLILLPGFSTAQSVTSVSGRGVGMDVVKRQIEGLRGSLNIVSEPGRGTCVSLTLPLTLAIIDGLLVEAGDSQYIIPMAVITENVELSHIDRMRGNGQNLVAVRGELIPYIDLRKVFNVPGPTPRLSKVVLVRYENYRVGIAVDRVLGTHQTVIQALGPFFRRIEVVSGTTIMGDGRVALILEVAGLVSMAEKRHQFAGKLTGSDVAA